MTRTIKALDVIAYMI